MVVDSINRVDLDLRKSLFSNIVLSGGSTLCRGNFNYNSYSAGFDPDLLSSTGFGDRLLNEVKKLALKDVKIKIYAPPERKYSTWIGGSILAGLGAFKKVSLSFAYCTVLTASIDVDISRRIPGRSGYHPQKIRVLVAKTSFYISADIPYTFLPLLTTLIGILIPS